jgi:hypothetical protein
MENKRKVQLTLTGELADYVSLHTWDYPPKRTAPDVLRESLKEKIEREKVPRGLRTAWQAMDDDEIRAYVKRGAAVNMMSIDVKLNADDAHRIIVELDHARRHRDLLNMRFMSSWLENGRLRRQVRELEKEVSAWRRRYMAASNPEIPDLQY